MDTDAEVPAGQGQPIGATPTLLQEAPISQTQPFPAQAGQQPQQPQVGETWPPPLSPTGDRDQREQLEHLANMREARQRSRSAGPRAAERLSAERRAQIDDEIRGAQEDRDCLKAMLATAKRDCGPAGGSGSRD